jgi:hypothetical protein
MVIEAHHRVPDSPALRPWIAGRLPPPREHVWAQQARWVNPLHAGEAEWLLALNRANCLAYDGVPDFRAGVSESLGMPRWVLLDCCLLPTWITGWEAPRTMVPPALADVLDPGGLLEWLPVSEYIALPTPAAGEVVGVSLFSFVRGGARGLRSKAMGLSLLGARRQVGVAQYGNRSLGLHVQFGPLHILAPQVAVHSLPGETFVYAVELPGPAALADWVDAPPPRTWGVGAGLDEGARLLEVCDATCLQALVEASRRPGARVEIVGVLPETEVQVLVWRDAGGAP